jgi:PilZ domain-containing protein
MSLPTGRSDRRIPKEVAVELARPDASQPRETAIAQNVSTRGMRVATEHVWRAGDTVLLSSPESGVRTQARVVYCQRMENNRFAVGLELLAPLGEWTKPH